MKLVVVGSGPLAGQVADLASTIAAADVTAVQTAAVLPGATGASPYAEVAAQLAAADWIFDVSGLPLDGKRSLLTALCAAAAPGAMISTDKSIVPLHEIRAGCETNGRRLAVTHVFAPPAQMQLAEIAAEPADLDRVTWLCETCLHRRVFPVPDQPGFIANRMGFFWLALVITEAGRAGLPIAEADAAAAAATGSPVGAFALADILGLDVVLALDGALRARLPASDPIHGWDIAALPLVKHLVATGALGRASGAGFYRRSAGVREAIDANSLSYGPTSSGRAEARAELAAAISGQLESYAAHIGATTGASLATIAEIMALGYGWTYGAGWRPLREG